MNKNTLQDRYQNLIDFSEYSVIAIGALVKILNEVTTEKLPITTIFENKKLIRRLKEIQEDLHELRAGIPNKVHMANSLDIVSYFSQTATEYSIKEAEDLLTEYVNYLLEDSEEEEIIWDGKFLNNNDDDEDED